MLRRAAALILPAMGSRSNPAANADLDLRAERAPRRGALVQVAPGPELPDARDKSGAQAGMAIALTLGGLFWAAAGVAAIYFFRR
ncbi:hypothetical protein [Phenylobacterium sp.]|uniref:hypothetical protein n=1 Tax=Phenylobacterium sp. TaxID=1871053 RepID=UPI002DED5A53|nr:hypothetical protein [Phenylobacterium sp.]